MIRNFFKVITSAAFVAGFCFAETAPVVAITQIAPHPSLDAIRQGIMDEIKEQHPNAEFIFENAQGNIATATQIAQKFSGGNPTVIVPITTPSAQSVYAAVHTRNIPVIFSAISDPVAAKLVPAMDQPGDGITGVADVPPIDKQIKLIQEILPNIKTLGIIYNPGEANSVAIAEQLQQLLEPYKINLVKAAISNTMDVASATQSLVGKVEAIYIGNDNTVVSALETVLKVSLQNKIPVFSSDPESVQRGCLAAAALGQYKIGRQTGKMVNRFLKGTSIKDLPVEVPEEVEVSVNLKTAQALGIIVSAAVLEKSQHTVEE